MIKNFDLIVIIILLVLANNKLQSQNIYIYEKPFKNANFYLFGSTENTITKKNSRTYKKFEKPKHILEHLMADYSEESGRKILPEDSPLSFSILGLPENLAKFDEYYVELCHLFEYTTFEEKRIALLKFKLHADGKIILIYSIELSYDEKRQTWLLNNPITLNYFDVFTMVKSNQLGIILGNPDTSVASSLALKLRDECTINGNFDYTYFLEKKLKIWKEKPNQAMLNYFCEPFTLWKGQNLWRSQSQRK